MAFELPVLPYAYDALEPYLDAKTMEIHHSKHHQAYIANANAVLKDTPYDTWSVEDILSKINTLPESIRTVLKNNAGGHANHRLFWESLSPEAQHPSQALEAALVSTFGSFEAFKEAFETSAKTRFGSGWAWLVSHHGKLEVISTPNQDSPLMDGKIPLLGLDVWEHAYYLHYQNRRPDYIHAFWQIVNWDVVSKRYATV